MSAFLPDDTPGIDNYLLAQGGPAFPFTVPTDNAAYSGMTLRAYIATAALQGLLANPKRYAYIAGLVESGSITQEEASAKNAHKAVMLADALLAELSKGNAA